MKIIKIIPALISVVLLVAASCSKNAEEENRPYSGTISASLADTDISTGLACKTVWKEGDAVVVNGIASKAIEASKAGQSVAEFTVNYDLEAPYKVFYPASDYRADGSLTFPTDQKYVPGQFDPDAAYLIGYGPDPVISMHYACAFVKVTIAKSGNETLKRVKLYSGDDTPICGDYGIVYDEARVSYKGGGSSCVSISGGDGIAYNARNKAEIVFIVPTGTFSKGFAISATTTDGKQMGRKAYGTSGVTLKGGSVLEMPEITFVDDDTPFSGGKGTPEAPYRIATAEDLQNLSDFCNAETSYADFAGKSYEQVADIDMGSVVFKPVCSNVSPFTGSYDGQNFSISNLKPESFLAGDNGIGMGMFGFIDGATLENIHFDGCRFKGEGFVGALASVMHSGKVAKVTVTNSTIAAPGGQTSTYGYSGGIVAEMHSGLIEDCSLDESTSITGKGYLGGIVGRIINNVQGETSRISDCHLAGTITNTGDYTGGIVGFINAGTEVKLSECFSYCEITGAGNNAGGIVGYATAKDVCDIDHCAAFGDITGQYAVGGICGYVEPNGDDAKMSITNSIYAGGKLTATGNNGANGYCLVAGIVGWWQNTAGYLQILNCASLAEQYAYPSTAAGYSSRVPTTAGIIGYQNGTITSEAAIKGCYSLVQPRGILTDGDYKIADNISYMTYYGGLYGKCSNALTFDYCFWDNSIQKGPGTLTAMTNSNAFGPMKELCTSLNTFVKSYSGSYVLSEWALDERGYPTPGISSKTPFPQPLRISVIGDSISTFRGWIPIGYSVYYYRNRTRQTDGKVCDVYDMDTYWNVLAYKLMPNAKIEKNIAWSGSCVSSVDGPSKPGYTERFETSGLGAPDIVLIHGGTNDFNHNFGGTGKEIPNTDGYYYEDEVPASVMQKLFDTPIDQLNTMNFLDAYVKLIKLIHEAHPSARIVIVIGDRPPEAMEHGMQQIADHYDFVKAVDFRAAGYNNLPKFEGSHPTKEGHWTMATKIYNELGSWLMGGA